MNETELHDYYLKKCSNLTIERLSDIQLEHVLYVELMYAIRTNKIAAIKRLIKILFFKIGVEFDVHGSDVLCLTTIRNRNDHDTYWNNIINLFDDRDNIVLNLALKKICLTNIFRKIYRYIYLYRKIDFIGNKSSRIQIASCLLKCILYKEQLDKYDKYPKVVMCFFDSEMLENLTIQYLKQKGTVSVTNQHSQPVYRDRNGNTDHFTQSQIFNLTADYFIAKGEFTRNQFIYAGINVDKIKVLGGFAPRQIKVEQNPDCVIGVFLDAPLYDFSAESNKKLIEIATKFCIETGYKYFVKVHPLDKVNCYKKFIDDNYCIGIFNKERPLEQLIMSMETGMLHASSVYIDIIMNNRKAYKLETEEFFPLVESADDIFGTCGELIDKHTKWKKKGIVERDNYLLHLREKYVWSEGFEDRYRKFIQELKCQEHD